MADKLAAGKTNTTGNNPFSASSPMMGSSPFNSPKPKTGKGGKW